MPLRLPVPCSKSHDDARFAIWQTDPTTWQATSVWLTKCVRDFTKEQDKDAGHSMLYTSWLGQILGEKKCLIPSSHLM